MIDPTPFENDLKLIETRFLADIKAMLPRLDRLSLEESLILLREIDYLKRLGVSGLSKWLDDMGEAMTDRVNEFVASAKLAGYDVVARSAPIAAMAQAELDAYIARFGAYGAGIRQTLMANYMVGLGSEKMAEQLQNLYVGSISSRNAFFVMSESLSRFDSAMKATIFEGDEDKALWTYLGPLDDRTRDACVGVLSNPKNAEGFTINEINNGDAGAGVDFIARGGMNCRHSWELLELDDNRDKKEDGGD